MQDDLKIRKRPTLDFTLGIFIAALFLNITAIHYMQLELWARVLPVVLFLLGLIGSVTRVKILRFLGWLGIIVFLLISLGASFPSEDYILGGPDRDPMSDPRIVSSVTVLVKIAAGLAITILLAWLYRRLGVAADETNRLADLEDRFR